MLTEIVYPVRLIKIHAAKVQPPLRDNHGKGFRRIIAVLVSHADFKLRVIIRQCQAQLVLGLVNAGLHDGEFWIVRQREVQRLRQSEWLCGLGGEAE